MFKLPRYLTCLLPVATLVLSVTLFSPSPVRAADHGDSPAASQDQATDLADLYLFRDPVDSTKVVLIGTFRGFIVPGEANNFATFDNNVKYRFEIYNKHVNVPPATVAAFTPGQKAAFIRSIVPNRAIEVTFGKRQVVQPTGDGADQKPNLRSASPQTASIKLIGFTGVKNRGVFTKTDAGAPFATTNPTLEKDPLAQTINTFTVDTAGANSVDFFAGEVDDPFFFDIPGFGRTTKAIHDGVAPGTAAGNLSRARDTFAGYNVLSIAIRLPASLIQGKLLDGSPAPRIGATFMAFRHSVQTIGANGPQGAGAYKLVERVGNPAVNVALIPYNRKNSYNVSTPKQDASGKFVGDIVQTITDLGLGTNATNIGTLATLAVSYGDLLPLDLTVANTGSGGGDVAGAGFPNGRRLKDDVIDTILTVLNNNNTLGDGVNASDIAPQDAFPYVHLPQQPRDPGVTDDNTRN